MSGHGSSSSEEESEPRTKPADTLGRLAGRRSSLPGFMNQGERGGGGTWPSCNFGEIPISFLFKMKTKAVTSLILGWFVPGLGHALLGKYVRALIFFVSITAMTLLGLTVEDLLRNGQG